MISKKVILISLFLPFAAQASQIFVYPKQGQSEDQMGRDKYECHTWASNQTGYDPTNTYSSSQTTTAAPQKPRQGGALRGALKGATVGAIVGEISDDDPRKGAGRGAAVGGLFGGMRQRSRNQRYEEELRSQVDKQQQQSSAQSGHQQDYKRAMAACLEARGYSVK